MHPMEANGWNRKNVYESFGFDECYYADDYVNYETIRGLATDSGNYDELIMRDENAKSHMIMYFYLMLQCKIMVDIKVKIMKVQFILLICKRSMKMQNNI